MAYPIKGKQVEQIVSNALAEDLGSGDVTTEALVPSELEGKASILVKRDGVLAGIDVAKEVFRQVDPSLHFKALVKDGAKVRKGDVVATVEGKVASILKAERTALNFLQHLSGIATETARYVDAVSGTKAIITDTRKTIPGLRLLEKYAVRAGGGRNHRLNLGDGVLIKDNHLAALRSSGVGLGEAVKKARERAPRAMKVEVEVESVKQAREALSAGADIIMLDNMNVKDMRRVVKLVHGRALLEASGGVTLDNVRSVAEAGVDLISVGALTHSAKALDISLEVEPA
jgi:nicotinate-nucleotide pyrophosphorylase (carboxylating)